MHKKKIKLIVKKLFIESENSINFKIISFKTLKDLNKKKIILVLKKKFLINTIKIIFYLIFKKKKFKKNFFLLYDFDSSLVGYNFFPDWPGRYTNISFLKSLLFWLKLFSYNLFFYNKIILIVFIFNKS